jgi:hypothetical protein
LICCLGKEEREASLLELAGQEVFLWPGDNASDSGYNDLLHLQLCAPRVLAFYPRLLVSISAKQNFSYGKLLHFYVFGILCLQMIQHSKTDSQQRAHSLFNGNHTLIPLNCKGIFFNNYCRICWSLKCFNFPLVLLAILVFNYLQKINSDKFFTKKFYTPAFQQDKLTTGCGGKRFIDRQ